MEENVATRLKFFLENQGLSNSQFADTCGIPRPTLSQLLTGRNKKISDVLVRQIHAAYPQLSVMWLLFGEGPMFKMTATDAISNSGSFDMVGSEAPISLKSSIENVNITSDGTDALKYREENALNGGDKRAEYSASQRDSSAKKIAELEREIMRLKSRPRKVVQITIYYDDNTFETFRPGA